MLAEGQRIDDQVDLAVADERRNVLPAFMNLADDVDGHAVVVEILARAFRSDDVIAQFLEAMSQLQGFFLIAVGDGNENRAAGGDTHLRAVDGFVQGFGIGLADTHDFACRFHFRPKGDFRQADLAEGEYRRFGGDVALSRQEAAAVAHVFQRFAQSDARRDFDDGEVRYLAQEGDGTARTGIYLDDVQLALRYDELDVDGAFDLQFQGDARRVVDDLVDHFLVEVLRRIDGDGVARMDAGPFDLFHNAGDEDVRAVGNGVDFDFAARHVFVDEDRMVRRGDNGFAQVPFQFFFIIYDFHGPAAENVRRTDDEGEFQFLRHLHGFAVAGCNAAVGTRNVQLRQYFVEPFAVFGPVHAFDRRAEDLDAPFCQRSRQVDRRLAAELADNADGLFLVDDGHDVFYGQRFKVQAVGRIEVRTYRFRVVVDDDAVHAGLAQRPGRMDGAVVEFDALADADRAGAENDDALIAQRLDFVFGGVAGIVVRRSRFKFGGAGVDHLEGRRNALFLTEGPYFVFRLAGKAGDDGIGHAVPFCQPDVVFRKALLLQGFFQVDNVLQFAEEPHVVARNIVNLFFAEAEAQSLGDDEEPFVVLLLQELSDFDEGFAFQLFQRQVVHADFQGTDGLEEGPFKAAV